MNDAQPQPAGVLAYADTPVRRRAPLWWRLALTLACLYLPYAWLVPVLCVVSFSTCVALAIVYPRSIAWRVAALFNSTLLILTMLAVLLFTLWGMAV